MISEENFEFDYLDRLVLREDAGVIGRTKFDESEVYVVRSRAWDFDEDEYLYEIWDEMAGSVGVFWARSIHENLKLVDGDSS